MTSLLDLAPASQKVQGVPVFGISIAGIATLMGRFPELRALLSGGSVDMSVEDIIGKAPEAVAAVIAAGVGKPGDAQFEEHASTFPIEWQADFLEAIMKATMPSGFGPFVERLKALAGKVVQAVPSEVSATAPDMTSPPPSPKSYKRGASKKL
jgi:hypothetical protein